MKLSELISALQYAKDHMGDLEVFDESLGIVKGIEITDRSFQDYEMPSVYVIVKSNS